MNYTLHTHHRTQALSALATKPRSSNPSNPIPIHSFTVQHDSEELFQVDLPILIKVKFVYHCLPIESQFSIISEQFPSQRRSIWGVFREDTHSSSSPRVSPSSRATLLRFLSEIFPVLSSSNSSNARLSSCSGFRARIFSVTVKTWFVVSLYTSMYS